MSDAMTAAQREVADAVLAEELAKRETLVVSLCGAHAYGFASRDSDLDLKGVWIAPTRALLGLGPQPGAVDRQEFVGEVEVDLTVNELGQAVSGLIKGNGNMLERILDPAPLHAGEGLDELRELVRRNLSKRSHAHYRGFAHSQRKAVDRAADKGAPTAKKVLYVLRTTLTGAHLLETGEVVPDLSALWQRYGFDEVPELIEVKREAERGVLPPAWAAKIPALLDRAFARLDLALERSGLPDQAPAADALEDWLIARRIADLGPVKTARGS
ncbi:putative nucleotidyltransferase [Enhygromyxa salina]|uniref:Putative nucleotidyltransferase n=1 Tax=Enhygromyxa salina TaxID=215803 RepID=A0A2S9YGA3_9BACT|nr:nucleotidyltransferase domain-containing protein [Enhygromyxa salina]PRQ04133.1 putative nucleotidyltransferase [Enhygromyxa salina]